MKLSTLEGLFRALDEASVRYLVVGGVAVNAHGYQRATQDLDLVVQLHRENLLNAIAALETLGFSPLLPVRAEEFADPEKRREWHETRNLEVFSMTSDTHPGATVDLFVREPFIFDEEMVVAFQAELAPGLIVPFVSLETLIAMKKTVGRPRDLDDAEHLGWILEERNGGIDDG